MYCSEICLGTEDTATCKQANATGIMLVVKSMLWYLRHG